MAKNKPKEGNMPTKKGGKQGENNLMPCNKQSKGGNKTIKQKITVTCLYCSTTYETDDPENFRMPHHRMPNHKHNTPCNGSNSGKKDFSWLGKFPDLRKKPEPQRTL